MTDGSQERQERIAQHRDATIKELRECGEKVFLKLEEKVRSENTGKVSFRIIPAGFSIHKYGYPEASLSMKLRAKGGFIDMTSIQQQDAGAATQFEEREFKLGSIMEYGHLISVMGAFVSFETGFKIIFKHVFGFDLPTSADSTPEKSVSGYEGESEEPSRIRNLFKNSNVIALLLVLLLFGVGALLNNVWKNHSPNRGDAKLIELRKIASDVTPLPESVETGTSESSGAMSAGVYKHYHLEMMACDHIASYYLNNLASKGWTTIGVEQMRGRIIGLKNGEFLIDIDNESKGFGNCDYSISYVWRDKNWR